MQQEKKISVIIPVYNTEVYFQRCLDSVLQQSHRALEVIVVNDGSPGEIGQMIAPYLERDDRVRYLCHEKNCGLFRARVTGMAAATGDYVAFLDSDDYLSQDFYRILLEEAEYSASEIVIGKTVWEDNNGRYVNNLHDSCFQFQKLEGEAVRQAYFSQEAACYSWHTVWNKLYSKALIDRCYPVFDRVEDHVIMTEDICFSSVFFYEAQRVTRVTEEAYFYCANETASTNTSQMTLKRFRKNLQDMTVVFNTVDRFLQDRHASAEIRGHFANARGHYARMWQNLLDITFSGTEWNQALEVLQSFCPVYSMDHVKDDFFFESIRTPWRGALEYFKERVARGAERYISFDIFDTLILRPFYQPEDLFELLNPKFRELTKSQVAFAQIRKNGEQVAREEHYRQYPDHQDITLGEIYECIGRIYRLSADVTNAMREEEIRLELRFAEPRKAGQALYRMAQAAGKNVLLVTDMYLEQNVIEQILQKNGYTGYNRLYVSSKERCLKYNGDLFRCVLRDFPDAASSTLHIGDTWQSDIEGSQKVGFANIFLPKTREMFENKIGDYRTNGCASVMDRIGGSFIDMQKVRGNLGLRTMMAVASQRYFDHPYRPFHPDTDLNADPWFVGYYLVGMHLMGLCKWIHRQIEERPGKTVHFLSRDGYLPMKAYELYCRYTGSTSGISYLQTSRKALMPLIAKEKISFYQLPVEYRAHTPMSLLKLLSFAVAPDMTEKRQREILKAEKISPDAYIRDETQYTQVIRCFLERIYSQQTHQKACEVLKQYFSAVHPGDVAFDMGYSGRIQAAICDACGRGVDVLFLHEDYSKSVQMRHYGQFAVSSFYDFRPTISGLFREHLLSDCAGSCIGYQMTEEGAVPVIEETTKHYTDSYVVRSIQQGALDFMEDYLSRFSDFLEHLDYAPLEVSLPLEGFMRHFAHDDLRIFGCSYFEDEVYGGQTELNIEDFLRQQNHSMNLALNASAEAAAIPMNPMESETLMDVMNAKPQWLRAILWMFIDFDVFKERLKLNIKRLCKK